jgi:DNA-directed RNA polymerase specialized sigma24 family protein
MDSPLGTVKSRIARARGHLRTILAQAPELFPRRQRQRSGEE